MSRKCFLRFSVMVAIIFLVMSEGIWADEEISLDIHKGSVSQSVYVSGITGETTYLPMRQMSELINIPIQWDGDTGSVIWQTYNQTTVITPGIEAIYVVKDAITVRKAEARPILSQGRVYLPLRNFELLGITVTYDALTTQRSIYVPKDINLASKPISRENLNVVRDLITKEKAKLPKKIGSFTTYFKPSEKNRTRNLTLAAEAINNYQVNSGKVFSFNKTVGPRTPERGYKEAIIFVNKKKVEGYGGGVCQVSTTLYNAVQNAGLSIVERHPHSLPVAYVPLGKDATVNYGTADFRFKNSNDRDITIQATVEKNKLTIEIYSLPGLPG